MSNFSLKRNCRIQNKPTQLKSSNSTGSIQYERIERVILEHTSGDAAQSLSDDLSRW